MTGGPVGGARYLHAVAELLVSVADTQAAAIGRVGEIVGRSVAQGGVVHLFGAGHSRLPAEDVCLRAASLTSSRAIWPDRVSDKFERFGGLAPVVLKQGDVRAGEVLFVISNSGINPMPIEVAQQARATGATVVGVGSRQHSLATASRQADGVRLMDVCDVFLDTGVPAGDALIEADGLPGPVGPASTIMAAALLHAVLVEATGWMVSAGHVPPVRISRNLPGGDEHNAAISRRYADRIPELRWV